MSVPIAVIAETDWQQWLTTQQETVRKWTASHGFKAKTGTYCIIPASDGGIERILAGVNPPCILWALADLPETLPVGNYHIETKLAGPMADELTLGWLLGSYQFTRYKAGPRKERAALTPPENCDSKHVRIIAGALNHARDLINMPANDLGPEELAGECRKVAEKFKATFQEIAGEALLAENYPAIYEVGKASSRPPRLIDMRWGKAKHLKITLVGKGVCFDSGGLDIKPSSGMKLMKKDMGGAAAVLALATIIMAENLPVRLRVLIPAVENSIAGNAYRPFDIINTRKGITVEVGNTDAEGRLILGDALYEADSEHPDLLIDCATLTGAARTAVGTEIAAFFTPSETLAAGLRQSANEAHDPIWRLPLWPGYRDLLKSSAADINSAPDGPYAGAITAALYLQEFVSNTKDWVHIDMMAWNVTKRPGRPVGGEAMAVRALYGYIKARLGISAD